MFDTQNILLLSTNLLFVLFLHGNSSDLIAFLGGNEHDRISVFFGCCTCNRLVCLAHCHHTHPDITALRLCRIEEVFDGHRQPSFSQQVFMGL